MLGVISAKTLLKRAILLGVFVAALAVGALALANLLIIKGSREHLARSQEELSHAQAAIVLGAQVHGDGTLSAALSDRVDVAIELYRAGQVEKLLLTGDHGQTTYDEVNSMRRYALERGIPPEDIFMDHAGFSTYDSMYRARDVFAVESAIVVTQEYHLLRAVYTARSLGLDASGFAADRHELPAHNYQREVLARAKAVLQLLLRPQPRFLGPVIPIGGDGRATVDLAD